MEISTRDLLTVLHGMGLGGLLLLCFSGAAVILYATLIAENRWVPADGPDHLLKGFFWFMAAAAWLAVLVGSYVIYPWYRARPPAGTTALEAFPQRLLMSSTATSGWHDIGMEWKEHIAWFAPICLTAAAYLFARCRTQLVVDARLRNALIGLLAFAFFSTCVAGFFGAMLNKFAPVRGGGDIMIMQGEKHG